MLSLEKVKYNLPVKGGQFTRESFRQ